MTPESEPSSVGHTAATLAVVVVTVVLVTFVIERTGAALAIAVLGMYVLHLMSLRRIRERDEARWEDLKDLVEETVRREAGSAGAGRAAGGGGSSRSSSSTRVYSPSGEGKEEGAPSTSAEDPEGLWQEEAPARDVPVPRNFALGTVALIREKMTPGEIDEVLEEQESRPGEYFGQIAVELGYLDEDELDELLAAQQEGLFTIGEIQDARRRLKAYQRRAKGNG